MGIKQAILLLGILSCISIASAVPFGGSYNNTTANATAGHISDLLGAGVLILACFMVMQLIGLESFFSQSVVWFMSITVSIGMFLLTKTMGFM